LEGRIFTRDWASSKIYREWTRRLRSSPYTPTPFNILLLGEAYLDLGVATPLHLTFARLESSIYK
jgi:hypothetical protein